jgi:hypothetical protein
MSVMLSRMTSEGQNCFGATRPLGPSRSNYQPHISYVYAPKRNRSSTISPKAKRPLRTGADGLHSRGCRGGSYVSKPPKAPLYTQAHSKARP